MLCEFNTNWLPNEFPLKLHLFHPELAKLPASHTPYLSLVTHADEPSMTSTQMQPATIKIPQASKKHMVKPACV